MKEKLPGDKLVTVHQKESLWDSMKPWTGWFLLTLFVILLLVCLTTSLNLLRECHGSCDRFWSPRVRILSVAQKLSRIPQEKRMMFGFETLKMTWMPKLTHVLKSVLALHDLIETTECLILHYSSFQCHLHDFTLTWKTEKKWQRVIISILNGVNITRIFDLYRKIIFTKVTESQFVT